MSVHYIVNPAGERVSVILSIAEYEALMGVTEAERLYKNASEMLRHQLSGYWSRRIDEGNRLVYRVDDDGITIAQCRGHYSPPQ